MHRTRADITGDQRPAGAQLPLNIHIPVQHVGAMGILVNVTVSNAVRIEADVGIDSAAKHCVRVGADNLERRSGGSIQTELIGQREHIENAEGSAHRGFSVLERIPGKANSWFEIFAGGIVVNEAVHVLWTARAGKAGRDAGSSAIYDSSDFLNSVVGIVRPGRKFIAQANVKGQVGTEPPVILHVACKQAFADGNFIRTAGGKRVQSDGLVVE